MKSLYLRIYLTLVVLLLAFAFGSAWLFQRHMEQERGNIETAAGERMTAMAELLKLALPPATAPEDEQAEAFKDWGQRLRMPVALRDASGRRIAITQAFERRSDDAGVIVVTATLGDGRVMEMVRGPRPPPGGRPGVRPDDAPPWVPLWLSRPGAGFGGGGGALAAVLVLLFVGVALGAFPVVRRLTRRLETLKRGVEQFGAGQLGHRVDESGKDEVAALAGSFNRAAARIEGLVRSNQSLLANASHELRSPLARLKMAFEMLQDAPEAGRERLVREIHTDVAELDALVEEVLLASRLDAGSELGSAAKMDLLGLLAEEAARAEVPFEPAAGLADAAVQGQERLVRRAVRNLLENARRYGGPEATLALRRTGSQWEILVSDRGPGVPVDMRSRIFEPFFRLPGHAEVAGGVGLGLSLVKQIAERHGGSVRCEDREGGGSVFTLRLPSA
ncbi:HAMP domain-containing sensor histidine kinase [Roseateles paludis]|jgi:signal transduction histidine kinase|uniref:histidine kinase n=1 Tax=Roseateles paludis TaxID=3145238 RepID=A0ABV0G586_9BURK